MMLVTGVRGGEEVTSQIPARTMGRAAAAVETSNLQAIDATESLLVRASTARLITTRMDANIRCGRCGSFFELPRLAPIRQQRSCVATAATSLQV